MLVIFSTLVISDADRRWIEQLRRRHDPQHGLVEAHFTFVFPFAGLSAEQVTRHTRNVAKSTSPIAFRLSRAEAVPEMTAPRSHVFLLPTQGAEQVRELHERLYSGPLARFRDPAIPYAPHVTVAAFPEHEAARGLAADLPPFDIPGELMALRLGALAGGKLTVLETICFS